MFWASKPPDLTRLCHRRPGRLTGLIYDPDASDDAVAKSKSEA